MTETVAAMHSRPLLLPRQERALRTVWRRALTIPLFLSCALVMALLTPVVVPLAAAFDTASRRRMATVRAWLMVLVFFGCESIGIVASAWLWVRHRESVRFLDANYHLQQWWARSLFRAGVKLFSLKVEIEGANAGDHGPVLVFSRHVSPIDNLLPAVFISDTFGVRLRWVINRSLLRDPCVDIVGNRLPNAFVANNTSDSEAEIRRVKTLGRTLGDDDGVLIFPEGGLYSPQRLQKVLKRLEAHGDAELLERTRRLRGVLPPRLGGSMALLDAARGVDVVFLGHTGLENATAYANILGGGLTGRTIRIRMWRVAGADIPVSREARETWLFDQWEELDRWVTNTA
jgi:1-acyl-sn-glycerol-3-phosphate acyltransferase